MLEFTLDAQRVRQIEAALRETTPIPPSGPSWTVSDLVTLAAVAIYRAELMQLASLPDHAIASPEGKEHFMGVCLRELEAAVDVAHDDLTREDLAGKSRIRIEWADEDEEPAIWRLPAD